MSRILCAALALLVASLPAQADEWRQFLRQSASIEGGSLVYPDGSESPCSTSMTFHVAKGAFNGDGSVHQPFGSMEAALRRGTRDAYCFLSIRTDDEWDLEELSFDRPTIVTGEGAFRSFLVARVRENTPVEGTEPIVVSDTWTRLGSTISMEVYRGRR
ncbi:MAG: hypothetical protein QGG40_06425 [Myxococcota bacterium]|jgi:hypothetical protein|nr:hypothetical protein [Myxococcota bacterium]